MVRYHLKGFYRYFALPGGKGNLEGNILVQPDGSFEGNVTDHGSTQPDWRLSGFLTQDKGLDTLVFLKCPPVEQYANIAYTLFKRHTDNREGTYTGAWGALPVKATFLPEYGLFVAQIDMSMCGIGDRAEIALTRF